MTDIQLIIIILAILNVIAFAMYGVDKYKAVKNKWRTPEKTLITIAFFAPFGSAIGMKVFHHKTRKAKFKLVYVFLILHVALIGYLYTQGYF